MKKTLATAAVVLSLTAANAASGATPKPLWKGDMFVTSVTTPCISAGTAVGDVVQAIYAPTGLPGSTEPADTINFFYPRGAAVHWASYPGTTLSTSTGFNVSLIRRSSNASINTPAAAQFTVSPSTITTSTPAVAITLVKSNSWGITGCTVETQGILTSHPQ